jgi:molecular chaperone DnaK (HSP70)
LADKFNALPERAGKDDVRTNVKAIKRLQKDAVKIKENLSSNRFASVKIPELVDGITLSLNLERTEVENAAKEFFSKVGAPATEAVEKAGLKIEDIDAIELIGGGVRVPKVTEMLE